MLKPYFTVVRFYMLLFVFALFVNNNLFAQEPAKSSTAEDSIAAKLKDNNTSAFLQAMQSTNKILKYPTAAELNNVPPDAEIFRKNFLAVVPSLLLKMKEIIAMHKEDEDDTTNEYPLKTVALPGTLDNYYEYVTDGMLVFDADLRGTIEKDLITTSATKRTAEWKLMLQKAFPELAPKMEDKTDATGNQFITISQPRTLINNVGKPGYTTSPGWTLTLQNTMGKIGRDMCLVLVPSNK